MVPTEELVYYAIYGAILVATFIILKSPKDKNDNEEKQNKDN
jgi:hypothetical protein